MILTRNYSQEGKSDLIFFGSIVGGGVVSCGCLFDGKKCKNRFPECPAFDDPGLNFGNGKSKLRKRQRDASYTHDHFVDSSAWYNDQHFHYGR